MRRYAILAGLIAAVGLGFYWYDESDWLKPIQHYVENQDVMTLEARYTPEVIMENHKRELLGDSQRSFQDPTLKFYPYLLMEVKFVDNKKTREGVILWSQVDGEMVLNTDTWEKTHGFEDAINSGATALDFRLLNVLAEKGASTRERLQKELNLDEEALTSLIESAAKKQLILVKGHEIQLHFENPKFFVSPQTKMTQWIVNKPFSQGKKVPISYGQSKIERVAKAAFGNGFAIKNIKEIYLPVYSIPVLNADGSILISEWNALNGLRIHPHYLGKQRAGLDLGQKLTQRL